MGVGNVRKTEANTASIAKLTTTRKKSIGGKGSEKVDKESSNKKSVEVELVISNTQKGIGGMTSSNEVQILASASKAAPTSTSKQMPVKKESPSKSTSKLSKTAKKQKSGSVVLKEEAQREFKRSLHGLADSMKG